MLSLGPWHTQLLSGPLSLHWPRAMPQFLPRGCLGRAECGPALDDRRQSAQSPIQTHSSQVSPGDASGTGTAHSSTLPSGGRLLCALKGFVLRTHISQTDGLLTALLIALKGQDIDNQEATSALCPSGQQSARTRPMIYGGHKLYIREFRLLSSQACSPHRPQRTWCGCRSRLLSEASPLQVLTAE